MNCCSSDLKKFFSFKGTATRGEWWAVSLVGFVFIVLFNVLIAYMPETLAYFGTVINIAFAVLIFWLSIATGVRRLQDRGKSPWNFLWTFIPVIGLFYAIYALGIAKSKQVATAGTSSDK